MTVIATAPNRFSTVVKYEHAPETRYCRDVVTANDAAATWHVGAVLGAYIASPTAVATAGGTNTGNGVMGAITMTSVANLQLGTYTLKITKAAASAGDFELIDPQGKLVGLGTVAVAYNTGGFSFTLATGATSFVVGDTFSIVVSGTVKYKLTDSAATDGSQIAKAVYIADSNGNSGDLALAATTDTSVLVLSRGPAVVAQDALSYGASITTAPLKAALYAQLAAVGIIAEVVK